MHPEVSQRIVELCEKIQSEHDPEKFAQIVDELNQLLEIETFQKVPLTKAPAISNAA